MDRTRNPSRARERKLSRALMIAFLLVLFTGVVLQISMMARLSAQNKRTVAIEAQNYELEARMGNLKLSLSQFRNRDRVAARALQLGMQQPDEAQLRVVNIPNLIDNTSAQSADSSGAEEMMD